MGIRLSGAQVTWSELEEVSFTNPPVTIDGDYNFTGTVTGIIGSNAVGGAANLSVLNTIPYVSEEGILNTDNDLGWNPVSNTLEVLNILVSDTGAFKFGGHTNSFPCLKRSSAKLLVRLADDSAGAVIESKADITTAVTVANLPTSPVEGMRCAVTDSNAVSFTAGIGSVVAGGGSTHVPVYYDGTNWRIG